MWLSERSQFVKMMNHIIVVMWPGKTEPVDTLKKRGGRQGLGL